MKVRVLGSHGGVAPGYHTSAYQLTPEILIDCGAGASLTPKEQACITDIFITHPHLDHVKDIPFIIENSFSAQREVLTLRSTPGILKDVQTHIFNNVIWPDFSKIPVDAKSSKVLLRYEPIQKSVQVREYRITPFDVVHPGNATGFLVEDGSSQVIFSGDTGPNSTVWKLANDLPNVRAIFTEITFPNRLDFLAEASGHYTLAQLTEDLKQLKKKIPIYISHFKPQYLSELIDEFYRNQPDEPSLILMRRNDVYEFN